MEEFNQTYFKIIFLGIFLPSLIIGGLSLVVGMIMQGVFKKNFGKTLIRLGAACGVIGFLSYPLLLKKFRYFFFLLGYLVVSLVVIEIIIKIVRKRKARNKQKLENQAQP